MAFPLLPLFLIVGAGAAVALVAAKNVRGQDVKLGARPIYGEVHGEPLEFYVTTAGVWGIGTYEPLLDELATGSANDRRAALRKVVENVPARATGIVMRFADEQEQIPVGGTPAFTVTITPSGAGWLVQVLDPTASVVYLKPHKTLEAGVLAGFDVVAKRGY